MPLPPVETCDCGARIHKIPHIRTGKLHPVEETMVVGGNIQLVHADQQTRYRIIPPSEREGMTTPTYISHFARCPNANAHRRSR